MFSAWRGQEIARHGDSHAKLLDRYLGFAFRSSDVSVMCGCFITNYSALSDIFVIPADGK
jgi:hypothetical protein